MAKVAVILADGFEEIEALTVWTYYVVPILLVIWLVLKPK